MFVVKEISNIFDYFFKIFSIVFGWWLIVEVVWGWRWRFVFRGEYVRYELGCDFVIEFVVVVVVFGVVIC